MSEYKESLDYLEREERGLPARWGQARSPCKKGLSEARPGKSIPDAQEAGWARFLQGHANFLRPGHDLPNSRRVESEDSRVQKEPP